jgi:DNA-binding XRE family transcriptional regulator
VEKIQLKNISERLKEMRRELGITQVNLAKSMGVTKWTIIDYESGKRPPPKIFVLALKEKYSVNPKWLLTGEGEMFVKKQEETGMDPAFIERLKKDLAGKDDSFYKSLSISKEKLFDIIMLGKGKLSRVEVIELARKLKQPVDKYLLLSGYMPKEFGEAFEDEGIVDMFRSMKTGEIKDEEVDQFISALSKFLKGYIAEKKEKARKRMKEKKDESK